MNVSPEWIAPISGLFGAVLVGVFTLLGARLATDRAQKLDRDRRAETEKEEGNQLLRAVRVELAVAKERYMEAVGRDIERTREEEAFTSIFQASENYFSVYDSAGQLLGRVSDPDTVASVVRAYTYMRSLIDTYHVNNRLLEQYQSLQSAGSVEAPRKLAKLKEYTPIIKELHKKSIVAIDEAQIAIQQYLGEPYSTVP